MVDEVSGGGLSRTVRIFVVQSDRKFVELFRQSLAIAGDRCLSEESVETSGTIGASRSALLASRRRSIGSASFSRPSNLFRSIPAGRQMSVVGEIHQRRSVAVVSLPKGSILFSRSSSVGSLRYLTGQEQQWITKIILTDYVQSDDEKKKKKRHVVSTVGKFLRPTQRRWRGSRPNDDCSCHPRRERAVPGEENDQ